MIIKLRSFSILAVSFSMPISSLAAPSPPLGAPPPASVPAAEAVFRQRVEKDPRSTKDLLLYALYLIARDSVVKPDPARLAAACEVVNRARALEPRIPQLRDAADRCTRPSEAAARMGIKQNIKLALVKRGDFKFLDHPNERYMTIDPALWARRDVYARFGNLLAQYLPAKGEMSASPAPGTPGPDRAKDLMDRMTKVIDRLSKGEQAARAELQQLQQEVRAMTANSAQTPGDDFQKVAKDWSDSPYVRAKKIGHLIQARQNVDNELSDAQKRFPDQIIFKLLKSINDAGPAAHAKIALQSTELLLLSSQIQRASLPEDDVMLRN